MSSGLRRAGGKHDADCVSRSCVDSGTSNCNACWSSWWQEILDDISWRVRISPNPADTEIHLEDINSDDSMWQTTIYNLQGQTIRLFDWQNDEKQDITTLIPGIYIFVSKNKIGKVARQKVVVF